MKENPKGFASPLVLVRNLERLLAAVHAVFAFTPNRTPERVAQYQEVFGKKDQTPIEPEEKGLEELL